VTTSGDIDGGARTVDGPGDGGPGDGATSAGSSSGSGRPSAGGPSADGPGSGGASAGGARRGGTRRLPQTGAAEVVVDATPEAVWAVLADATRIGEWSHECRGAEWLDGATAAAPGVRFRGRNRAGALVRWARVCVIRAVDPPHEFVWETVGPPLMRDATLWRVQLDPVDGGTRIRQEFRILSMAAWADRVVAALLPAHRDRMAALEADLRRLGEVSAGGRRTS
jgi:uncharacterized protein YndB with AHSA1/START domain